MPSVGVYRGQLTAEARKASGFESRVNLIGGRGKTRFDRRHHAMDALVIALMNPSVSCTLALRVNMRDAQRLAGLEETWKNFYGKPGEASKRFESWRESMLRGVELFNIELSNNAIPFVENIRLRLGSSVIHDATVHSFCPPKTPDGEQIITKGYGEQHRLGDAHPVELIDRAETPALWTALTRCPDFDPKKGLPANPNRTISVNGTRVGPMELLNFFEHSKEGIKACLKVRGGYVELGSSIHHARIYRIDGKKPTYTMVRVFQVDLLRLKDQDLFTTPLKSSTISMRAADPKIRKALNRGTARQIGWLVRGDELCVDSSAFHDGIIGEVTGAYPELSTWKVAGFPEAQRMKLRPYLLAKEGLEDDEKGALRKVLDTKGWQIGIHKLLSSCRVTVIRRNCLGEERLSSENSMPVTMVLE